MPDIAVYRFEMFDLPARRFRTQAGYGTRAAIDGVRGLAMIETRQEVSVSEVDAEGWYIGAAISES